MKSYLVKCFVGALFLALSLPFFANASDSPAGISQEQWDKTVCRYLSGSFGFHGQLGTQPSELPTCLFLHKSMILSDLISNFQIVRPDRGVIEYRSTIRAPFIACPYAIRFEGQLSEPASQYLIRWRNMGIGGSYRDGLTSEIEQEIETIVETNCPLS